MSQCNGGGKCGEMKENGTVFTIKQRVVQSLIREERFQHLSVGKAWAQQLPLKGIQKR